MGISRFSSSSGSHSVSESLSTTMGFVAASMPIRSALRFIGLSVVSSCT